VVLLTGCTTVMSQQRTALSDVQQFADATARVYKLSRPVVVVGTPSGPGSLDKPTLFVRTDQLTSPTRDQLVAHELAHYVLGHGVALKAADPAGREAEQYRREVDAHVKAVEILARYRNWDEAQALKAMYAYLMVADLRSRPPGSVVSCGHRGGCVEVRAMLSHFPEHYDWTSKLQCAPLPPRAAR